MTRAKVELAYIADHSLRKATFNKRKNDIIKKLKELTFLTGLRACAIISSVFNAPPEVWPNTEEAMDVVEKYHDAPALNESDNLHPLSFMMQTISKLQDVLEKKLRRIREDELTMVMFNYMEDKTLPEDLSFEDCNIINELVQKKIEEIDLKIAMLS
ncbi:agamous-like MADS-box protein AGL80 [Lotus japonicus]|uniref:agamous-like MADS-box protein AGL80 n=1 Tax=Lotus japonicus TaxID=34305 RepID=UPI00258BA226|nr:agamous-like MADS-box protein AGL80 [Lotus japonicus]